jgi:hypothetical protein
LRAYRVDKNQKDIVTSLRDAGYSVQHLHSVGAGCPDILVGINGINILIEIKEGDGKLTPAQIVWHSSWLGQVDIAKNKEEAIGIVKNAIKQETEKKEKSGGILVAHNYQTQRRNRDSIATSAPCGTAEVSGGISDGGELAHDSGEAERRSSGNPAKPWTNESRRSRSKGNAKGKGTEREDG